MPPINPGSPKPIRNLPETASAALPVFGTPVPREGMTALAHAWRQNNAPLPPGLAGGPDLAGLWKAFKRRWLLAVSLGVVFAVAVAAAVYILMPPKNTAFVQIHLDSVPQTVYMSADAADAGRQFSMYQSTQAAKLKSRFVLNAALRRDEVRSLPMVQAQSEPVLWLEDELKVEFKEGQEFLTLTMSLLEPDAVVAIVAAVSQAYLQEVNQEEPKRKSQRLAELQDIVAKANIKLKQKKDLFRQRADEIGTSDGAAVMQKQVNLLAALGLLRADHGRLRTELMRAETKLKTHLAGEKADPPISETDVKSAVSADPFCQTHLQRLSRVQDVIDEYLHGAKNPESEPTYRLAQQRLAAIKKELDIRIANIREEVGMRSKIQAKTNYQAMLGQLQTEHALAGENEKTLRDQVDALAKEAEKIGIMSTEMEMLRSEIDLEGKVAKEIDEKSKTLEVEVRAPSRVSVAQEAGLQRKEIKRFLIMLILGPLAAFGGVCLGISWLEFRARRIRSADEVMTGLGMRVVGAVPALMAPPHWSEDEAGDGIEDHALLESIDGIRTVLLKNASVEATRVIMVTSAVAGEGKTTLASHLATSLARAGRKTLLIDCDLRSPAVHQLFELPQQPGLSEVLLNEVHVAEATRSTTVDGLWVIPAGQWDRSVMVALARNGVEEIFDKLKSEYDFIVIDSHPVLPANDSLLIGQHVDTVLLSVLRDVSQAPRVYTACQRLSTLGIRILGAVVNGMPHDDYYGGYHDAAQPAQAAA